VGRFDIRAYLRDQKSIVDRAMDRYLGPCGKRPPALYQAMRYGVFSGGKRFRPILTLASGTTFGGRRALLLPFACALELIHTYSIIHDDLPEMDDDDFRRGRPANHKVFGEGIALLAGDALLTEAFHLMSRPELKRDLTPDLILGLIHEICRAAGVEGMVGGQAVDLKAEGREVELAVVESIHELKTGALISAAAWIGAKIAGAKQKDVEKISRYGKLLGLAFQITDDILDAETQDPVKRGGSSDQERKKATYPSVVGLAMAKERVRELTGRCLKEVIGFGPAAEPLRGIAGYVLAQALKGHSESRKKIRGRVHVG
jgi:geranylgeranyl diphosphate synthase type II